MVERLVGIDWHQYCGDAEGVVVDQEESGIMQTLDYVYKNVYKLQLLNYMWTYMLNKFTLPEPWVVDEDMVEEVMVEEEKDLINWVVRPNPLCSHITCQPN